EIFGRTARQRWGGHFSGKVAGATGIDGVDRCNHVGGGDRTVIIQVVARHWVLPWAAAEQIAIFEAFDAEEGSSFDLSFDRFWFSSEHVASPQVKTRWLASVMGSAVFRRRVPLWV